MNSSGDNNMYGGIKVMRTIGSGTAQPIGISTAVSLSNQRNASFSVSTDSGGNSEHKMNTFGFKFLDEPTTTDDVTYQLQVYTRDAEEFNLNRPHGNGNSILTVGTTSSITAYEVTV